jgi:hypothetical protein
LSSGHSALVPPLPTGWVEQAQLESLQQLQVLGRPPEPRFDAIVRQAELHSTLHLHILGTAWDVSWTASGSTFFLKWTLIRAAGQC